MTDQSKKNFAEALLAQDGLALERTTEQQRKENKAMVAEIQRRSRNAMYRIFGACVLGAVVFAVVFATTPTGQRIISAPTWRGARMMIVPTVSAVLIGAFEVWRSKRTIEMVTRLRMLEEKMRREEGGL